MATNKISDIEFETIDGEYPVAGVDNDTQGFRDNFSIIKAGLQVAQSEITSILLDSPTLSQGGNFNGSTIAQANFKAVTESKFNPGTINQTDHTINFSNGHYQEVDLNEITNGNGNVVNDVSITIDGWTDSVDVVSKITVRLRTIIEGLEVSVNWNTVNGVFKVSSNWPSLDGSTKFMIDNSDTIVEFWTANAGATVFANYIGKFSEL